jgi:hypothetical protein
MEKGQGEWQTPPGMQPGEPRPKPIWLSGADLAFRVSEENGTEGSGCCIENAGVLPWVHHAQDAYSEATQTEGSSGAIWIGTHIRAVLQNPVQGAAQRRACVSAGACKAEPAQLVGTRVAKAGTKAKQKHFAKIAISSPRLQFSQI